MDRDVLSTKNQNGHPNSLSTSRRSIKNFSEVKRLWEKEGSHTPTMQSQPSPTRPLVFHCQLAHGSPTSHISGFTNVKELYQKIAIGFALPIEDILYCTLNTHLVDMDRLLGAQLSLEDFIFVHRKGQKKEVEIHKSEVALGLTISDNGNGYSFIKRIKDGSVIQKTGVIHVGDHIERIQSQSVAGWRHVAVAQYLKNIPVDTIFTMRLIEPLRSGFANIGPRNKKYKGVPESSCGSGKETIRFRSNGSPILQIVDNSTELGISKVNALLEDFVGINDAELATQIWDLGTGVKSAAEFSEALDNSELKYFEFSNTFILDTWKIILDTKTNH